MRDNSTTSWNGELMSQSIAVVKLGGTEGVDFSKICADAAELLKGGKRLVFIHGGSAEANSLGESLGMPPKMITSPSGYTSRYTDRKTLEIFLMAVNGKVNSLLTEQLQLLGINAFGLSGLDGKLLQATRKDSIQSIENGKRKIIRDDYTGKIETVNRELLVLLLSAGYLPVIAPVAVSEKGEALNVDADRAAAMVASALKAETLILLTAVPGLMKNFPDESTLIRQLPGSTPCGQRGSAGTYEKESAWRGRSTQGWCVSCRHCRWTNSKSNYQCIIRKRNGNPMNTYEILEIETHHSAGTYTKQPLVIVRGQGASLFDADGVEYLDCASGHGVANLGHAHPKVAEAIYKQASALITLFESFPNDKRAELIKKITSLVNGLDRVFLCNSGTESVEAAFKFARISTGRKNIVAAMRAFHGRTYGSLSATFNKKYREGFEPLVPGFSHVAYNNIEALDKAVNEETAAVILEVVQGEGGVYPATIEYIQAARRICTERGALLIVDEIQTGFGRTGKMFAIEHFTVIPDMLCCAKSLAGGLPMGAVLIGPKVTNLTPGVHASTFGGNPLACAAAVAALGVIEDEDLPRQSLVKGAYLMDKLRKIESPNIREVRGMGLMIGIELKHKVAPYLSALQEKRIIALNAGMTVIRLLPPLVISYGQIDHLVDVLTEVLVGELVSVEV
jgi:LysW-gamma-L-lysine/LysW-L-ornithine aminotransferase